MTLQPNSTLTRFLAVWTTLFDSILWIAFICLVVSISFTTKGYDSLHWLINSAALFTLALLFLLRAGNHASYVGRVLHHARWVLLIFLLSSLWLLVQWKLPFSNPFFSEFFQVANAPRWFQPAKHLSIVAEQTRWQFLASIFELTLLSLTLVMVHNRARIKQLLWVLMLIGAGHATLALSAKFGGFYLVDVQQLDGHFNEARGIFVNRNHLAAMLGLGLFGGFALLVRSILRERHLAALKLVFSQLRLPNLLFSALILLSIAAILLSQSRAGFLALIVALMLSLLVFPPASRRGYWLRRLLPIGLLLLLPMLVYFGQELTQRLSADMLSLGERAQQWSITWQAIKTNPIIGYGAGSYPIVFQIWREYADLRYVIFYQSHNFYLHIWLEQGLLGLALWCCMIGLVLRAALIEFFSSKSTLVKGVLVASVTVIIAASIQSMVDFNLQIMNIRSYFFVIIALSLAAPQVNQTRS